MSSTATSPTPAPRKAFRSTDERLLGGVAAGLALHLGVDVVYVRAAFLLATALGGLGAAAYAGLWLILPTDTHLEQSTPGLVVWVASVARSSGGRPTRPSVSAGWTAAAASTWSARWSAGAAWRPGRGWRWGWDCCCRPWSCSPSRPVRRASWASRATWWSRACSAWPGWP